MILALTGGTGFIGSHVLKQALMAGYTVRALYHHTRPAVEAVQDRVTWMQGDIAATATWDELLRGADTLIHLGAAGVANLNNVFDAVHTNLPGHACLLQEAARCGIRRLVLAGSCFEYGRTGERIGNRGLREDDPLDPINVYAAAKAAATLLTTPLSRDLGLECFVLRPFHTYGAGEMQSRLIPMVVRSAITGTRIQTTDGLQIRDLVHVSEVADAFLRALLVDWPFAGSGTCILNIGTGRATTIRNVVEILVRQCGRSVDSVNFGALAHREHEMWRLVADPRAAQRVLGWKARIELEAGLEQTVREICRTT